MDLELRVLGCGSNVCSGSSRVVMEKKIGQKHRNRRKTQNEMETAFCRGLWV